MEKFLPISCLYKLSMSNIPWTSLVFRKRKCSLAIESLLFPLLTLLCER